MSKEQELLKEMYAFIKSQLGGAIDDMFSENYTKIKQALEDYELYKRALDIACFRLENCNWNKNNKIVEQIIQETLDLARKELSNERHIKTKRNDKRM